MEFLSHLIHRALSSELIEPIQIPNGDPSLSHLLFADYAILLGIWSERNITNMARLLRCFHMVTGLKINLSKCSLFGINMADSDLMEMATRLHCRADKFPCSYLGLRDGENMNLVNSWKPVEDIFEARLSKWKVDVTIRMKPGIP
ncbi:uncharacterized protein LOC143600929 [Bidens hawaiensis]|uniref:uncharacterized protein LOC143600929 n=1 Tax=Bidens hawaiensis TaxID=980011 RepID=UPI00404B7B32